MDRAGRLAAGCLLALMSVLAAAPLLVDGSAGGWARGGLAVVGGVLIALVGGVALLTEARAGVPRPGLGTPVDTCFGLWLLAALLARLVSEPELGRRGWPLTLLLLALAYLLTIRTLTSPARAKAATTVALAALAVGSFAAGAWLTALLAASFGAVVSAGLARAVRPDASPALRKLARAFGKAAPLVVLALIALSTLALTGALGERWERRAFGIQFSARSADAGWLSSAELVVLVGLLWELRRVAIRGAALLVDDAARRAVFHVQVGALAAVFVLGWFTTPLGAPALGVPTVVLVAAASRAGCDARNRVATPRAQLVAVLAVLAGLALCAWTLGSTPPHSPR